ncbi:MAG: hypothetical protein GY757_20220 [bacterium]|nr:hypothetical protein [bacterium]
MRNSVAKLTMIIMAVCLVFTFTVNASVLDKSILPAGTQWVLHLDVQRLNDTTLFKKLIDDKTLGDINSARDRVLKEINVDPFKDVSGVTVFGNQEHGKDMVCYIYGNLGAASKAALAKMKESKNLEQQQYHNETIYSLNRHGFVVFKSNKSLLFSKNETALKNALDVVNKKKKSLGSSDLLKYVDMIPKKAFLSAAVANLSKMRYHGPQAMILNCTGAATFMSLEANNNLTLKAMLKTDTLENAQNIENIVRGLMALGSIQSNENFKPYAPLLNAIRIERKKTNVNLEFTYPSEELIKILKTHKRHIKHHDHKHDKDHKD